MSAAEAGAVALIAKLQNQGYARTDVGSAAMMHKREFRLSRFGNVDTVVGVMINPGVATGAAFEAHDESTKAAAMGLKSKLPLGFGSAVELFPVMFAESADASAIEAAQGQSPKRWAIMSSRALVHGPQQEVVLFEGRAIWGAAYVKSQRTKLRGLLA